MTKLGDALAAAISGIPGVDGGELIKAQRIAQVRAMWKGLVDPIILAHTNGVYVFTEGGGKQMHVYVDESIFAAELNNQRELLKLQMMERYGEKVDELHIHISKGKYKSIHPFENTSGPLQWRSAPLSASELDRVEESCGGIGEGRLKDAFKRAMIADLEWKKGLKR
ncbi:DciA family protein [Curtanaerobium respiraculi]|uniref:DciA family protein n=1 Tax=Curtanaerobium respiraculi TaxID=2949669 RepID=UPI0024B33CBE|nr:DciA family protein [Curtanaerobium respiraculi]